MLLSFTLLLYGLTLSYLIGKISWSILAKATQIDEEFNLHISLFPIIGLAAMSPFIGMYHLFFKIDLYLHFFFFSWIIGSAKNIPTYLREAYHFIQKNVWLLLLLLLGTLLSILLRPGTGDIADYHLQAIQWAERYANIPGLGNFNRPLANNNWWFNLQAFFGFNFLGVKSVYIGNALFYLSAFLWFFLSPFVSKAQQWMRFFFSTFIILSLKTAFIGAVTPDYIVTLMIYLVIDLFVISSLKTDNYKALFVLLILFTSWILTVKATSISFLMLPMYWMLRLIKDREFKVIWKSIIIQLMFIIPWLIGNIIICGYLLYPFNEIDLFDVDWKVPSYFFEFDKIVLSSWGKVNGQDIFITQKMRVLEWLPLWFNQLDIFNKVLIFTFLLSSLVVTYFAINKKELIWPILFNYLSFFLIFFNGPHPRFLFGYMVSSVAFAFYLLDLKISFKFMKTSLIILCLILTSSILFKYSLNENFTKEIFIPKPYPNENLETKFIKDFKFYKVKSTNMCWDNFPCSYYFIDSVTLRGSNIENGFKIDRKPINY